MARRSAACAFCGTGAASWTCPWTARPIIDRTPIDGLYLNGGWCYGGFKATPASGWCFAHLIARDEPHALTRAFRLDRFAAGRVIDEKGAGRSAQPALTMTEDDVRIVCPFCGERGNEEFTYLGDAVARAA